MHIARISSTKILGVSVSNRLSLSHYVQNVVTSCAQTVHALRTLRSHSVMNTTQHIVFKSVVVAKLVYAASDRHGFCTAADRHTLLARKVQFGPYCTPMGVKLHYRTKV